MPGLPPIRSTPRLSVPGRPPSAPHDDRVLAMCTRPSVSVLADSPGKRVLAIVVKSRSPSRARSDSTRNRPSPCFRRTSKSLSSFGTAVAVTSTEGSVPDDECPRRKTAPVVSPANSSSTSLASYPWSLTRTRCAPTATPGMRACPSESVWASSPSSGSTISTPASGLPLSASATPTDSVDRPDCAARTAGSDASTSIGATPRRRIVSTIWTRGEGRHSHRRGCNAEKPRRIVHDVRCVVRAHANWLARPANSPTVALCHEARATGAGLVFIPSIA